jgi:hypothetical protein
VTALRAPGSAVAGGGMPSGPAPRRVRPPRWLDLRLVLGVLLVLGSVLLGARVVSAADATVPVWAASADLAPGTKVSIDDLVAVDVRLDAAAKAYLSTSERPDGWLLSRAVRAGGLLPSSALEETSELVQVALPVQAGYVPPALARGQLIDVYAVADPAAGATAVADGSVTLVVEEATVQETPQRAEGVLSTPTTTVQVVISVRADEAAEVLGAIAGRPLVVVLHESVDADGADSGGRSSGAGDDDAAPGSTSGTPTRTATPTGPTG